MLAVFVKPQHLLQEVARPKLFVSGKSLLIGLLPSQSQNWMEIKLTVHFIGAGPGDPELITLKGKKLLEQCSICFFAGSIIPEEILSHCGPSNKKNNTAPLSLSQIIEKIEKFHNEGHEIARLHSGDLSIWSAVNEQIT